MARQSKSTLRAQGKHTHAVRPGDEARDGIAVLTADHRTVEELFAQYESADSSTQKAELARRICTELSMHTMLEEEIFYPACREKGVKQEALDEAQVEHDSAKLLVYELMTHSLDSAFYEAKVRVLSNYISHHISEEERAGDGIFALAAAAGVDMNALGEVLRQRKSELVEFCERQEFRPPPVRSLDLASEQRYLQENETDRRYERERDEEGLFSEGSGGYWR
jgi:hypothetical protein